MENYICIGGKKTELTHAQVKELGFAVTSPFMALVEAVKSGSIKDRYKIHDTIAAYNNAMMCNYWEFEIIGFDHDKVEGGGTAAVTLMVKALTHSHVWHFGACERGWIDTDLRRWLNEEFINKLPDEIKPYLCSVVKTTHNYKGDAYETTDKLFIPSESEFFGSAVWSDYEDGARYEAFGTSEKRVKEDEDGDPVWYWTRSAGGGSSTSAALVSSHGGAYHTTATHTGIRVPVCFCIA